MKPGAPPSGPRRVRLALFASVGAGASLALAAELTYFAATGGEVRTAAAVPVIAMVVGAAGLAVAAVLARNEESTRRHGRRVQRLGDPAIDTLEDEALLDTLATRLREALAADQVVVLLEATPDPDSGPEMQEGTGTFQVVASTGLAPGAARTVPATAYPVTATTSVESPPPALPPGWGSVRTALSQPVTGAGSRLAGVVFVGWDASRTVRADDEDLTALAAGRVWSVVHRQRLIGAESLARLSAEGARRQLAVLAAGGPTLASALNDYADEVAGLADVCVPAFADLCAIDLVGDAGRLCPAVFRSDPSAELTRPAPEAWHELLERVLAEGHTRFGFVGGTGTGDLLAEEVLALLQASSVLVAPIQAGGLSLGTVAMATGPGRRGFRTSDVAVVAELARRLGLAVQRVLLHREAVASAEAQARTARRLRRLTDAAIALAGMHEPGRLLGSAASEARRVLQASAALVVYGPPGSPERRERVGEAEQGDLDGLADAAMKTVGFVARDGCLAAPLLDRHQTCRGALVVASPSGGTLDADDEVALVTLAHLVSLVVGQTELTAAVSVREARMHALLDASPVAILSLSPQAQVIEGNPAARQLLGWPDGASTGPLPPAMATDLLDLAARAARGEATGDAQIQGEGPDGDVLDLVVAAAPVRDDAGTIDAVLLMLADVSGLRRAERQLELAQRLEAMGQVAGGVAHDFNNLLTVIVGYTEALLAATDDDDPTRPLLESIDRAGASAAALTSQLLGLARRRPSQPLAVDASELMGGLEPVVRRLAGVNIDVVVDIASSPPVVADPVELEQMVLNLAINARDAMPDGGRLEIAVRPVALDAEEAEEHRLAPGPYVELSVADTGTGMDDETLARCFEPFFTRKERGRGTGLGLAAVYATATEGGGNVAVSSRLGEGTTFRVWLPCTEERPAEVVDTSPAERPAGSGRVLLVEDEHEIRDLARQALEASGFTVVAAANASAAIAAFEQASAPFDVLVSDIVMPGMRGTELAGLLRERQPSLEVLYVSGYAGVGQQVGETIDGVGVLRKPFRARELCLRVVRLAERARAAPQGSKR